MASYLDQLIQEFSMPDIAGQAGITAQPQAAVSGIDQLQALINQQEELRKRQQSALSDYSALAAKRPGSRLLEENKGLAGFFKDPSEAQRAFMINAGLKLAMGDSTRDLSARLAESLGQGVGALQASRASDIKQQQIQAKSKIEQLALEQEGLADKFGQTKDMATLQKQQQQLDFNIERAGIEDDFARQRIDIQQQGLELNPEIRTLNRYQKLVEKGDVEGAAYLKGIMDKDVAPSGGMTIYDTATGNPIFQSGKVSAVPGGAPSDMTSFAKEYGKEQAKALADAESKAQIAVAANRSFTEWEGYLNQGMETGPGRGLSIDLPARASDFIQSLPGNVPFVEGLPGYDDEKLEFQLARRGAADALSKEMGARRLEMFGGNDSERELLVSLLMNPSIDKTVPDNKLIIKNNKAANQALIARPAFVKAWIKENGGLGNADKQGKSFEAQWSRKQLQDFKEFGGKVREEDLKFFSPQIDAFYSANKDIVNVFGDEEQGLNPTLNSNVNDILTNQGY